MSESSCRDTQNSPCMHSVWPGVDSGDPVQMCIEDGTKQTARPKRYRSRSSCGIMRQHCDDGRNEVQSTPALAVARECTLLWIQTKFPVHAPCLDWSRFWRSGQKALAVSCGILRKVEPDLIPCEIFISSPLGSSGLSDFSTDDTRK